MDSDDIKVFIDKLNLQLNLFSFDWMAPIPMPFSDLARANRVSDKAFRSLNLPEQFRGKLFKELLKTVETGCLKSTVTEEVGSASKRKHNPSSYDIESASKYMKIEQDDCKVESSQSCSSTFKKQDEGEKETENEDQLNFKDKKVCNAIHHLNAFLEKDNLEKLRTVLNKSRDEGELEIGLGIHLFTKLAGKAVTNQKKSLRKCPCGCVGQVKSEENMWIGSQNTWYGELDILTGNPVKGDSVSVSFAQETADGDIDMQGTSRDEQFESDTSEEGDQGESPGDRTNIEVKYSGLRLRPGLNQVIAQAVVFAFTEYNRHKTKGKCIPSILIDKSGFQYVIYNPVDDILLVSNYMMFGSKDSFDPATGFRPFVVLWMILNHRIFFAKNPSFKKPCVKSGFHQQISDLEPFKMLSGYSKNISIINSYYFPNDTPNTIGSDGLYWFLNRKSLI